MIKLASLIAAGAVMVSASSVQAAIVADFELNGSTANSVANGVTLTNNAGSGSLTATGINFGQNNGPIVNGLSALPAYTISMQFTLDTVDGHRGNGYVKLIDYSNLASDAGVYDHYGYYNTYPLGQSATIDFTAGQSVQLTVSRDAAGTFSAYIGDTLLYSVADPSDTSATAITGLDPLIFFTDDYPTGQQEWSSGTVDYIRIYDTAITPSQAVGVGGVPEPATWAMMISGLALIGGLLRHRQAMATRTA